MFNMLNNFIWKYDWDNNEEENIMFKVNSKKKERPRWDIYLQSYFDSTKIEVS